MKKIYLLFFSLCYLFSAGQELDANIHEINYLGGLDARNIIKHDNKLIFAGAEIFESVANQNYELWGYDYNSKKTTLIKEHRSAVTRTLPFLKIKCSSLQIWATTGNFGQPTAPLQEHKKFSTWEIIIF